ncbi:MAG TPA: glycine cleavage T C-terminal barrel domain-containing protein [Gemmatimonadaceae bacterium]|nr:glycine cleavage T C-terminal barrel domain-containing protein [Gemmatimonadaceae bacterium]
MSLTPPSSAGGTSEPAPSAESGNVEQSYAALRESAVVVDRSHRLRLTLDGPRAAETLAGLVTSDVLSLKPGAGQYGAALSPKGKIIADVRIFARDDGFVVDAPPRAAEGLRTMFRKFVNPRGAKVTDRSSEWRSIAIGGPKAAMIAAGVSGVAADELRALDAYGHVAGGATRNVILVASIPVIDLPAFELIVPTDSYSQVHAAAVNAGAFAGDADAWEIARMEAGYPEWGVDIDDSTIPQEANFDGLQAISYTKGCYVGQETVARVHFRGHVNRHLRGLILSRGAAVPRGAAIADENGKPVGDVRSVARSPRLGWIAMAMIRREVLPPARVSVSWEDGNTTAQVVELPFPEP